MKKITSTIGALTIAAALTTSFTACSSEENITPESLQPTTVKAPVYNVTIPANYDNDETRAVAAGSGGKLVSTFRTTDNICAFLYDEENIDPKSEAFYRIATDNNENFVFLHADADGKKAHLAGALSFYYNSTPIQVNVGNKLRLVYNSQGDISYNNQTGTFAGLSNYDYAVADVQVTAVRGSENAYTLSTTDAQFTNLQSMYKFCFTGLPTGVGVKSVSISTASHTIVSDYSPIANENANNTLAIMLDDAARTANGDGVVYAALRFNKLAANATDDVTFVINGTDNNIYRATKTSPVGGFENGKYYTSTISQLEQIQLVAPAITWTTVNNGEQVTPDAEHLYHVYGPFNSSKHDFEPSEITISGASIGYWFWMDGGATIHLNNVNGSYDNENNTPFFYSNRDLSLDISGTNIISCKHNSTAITVGGSLKLSGNGKLIVTAKDVNKYGIVAYDNYWNSSTNADPSVLAATGYTVTRSATHDNGDGTYTWTYTVVMNP